MIIIGANGLGKELLTVLSWNDDTDNLCFFDEDYTTIPDLLYGRFPVLKSWEALKQHFLMDSPEFALGVGSAVTRKMLSEKVVALGGKLCSIISNDALIGEFISSMGDGVCILSQAILTCDVQIGNGTLINKAVIISHEAKVGQYCAISPGAKILGGATIGDCTEIGTNAVVLPGVKIGSNCTVGAGAVVTKNVADNTTVVGVPAHPIKSNVSIRTLVPRSPLQRRRG
jgi:sugar O-acyltransferase (sialic acid O-acetyltransferase NeuD family)